MNLEKMDAEYFTEIVNTVIHALQRLIEFIESHILSTKFAFEDKYED